ncbi:TrkH family potassium uptake protein [Tianweitania sp. BSSL-BM11]|uniref:Trk system potassium uptake protein n=1 Tax=Tianweitania aestuarii TaxID=2814886 RepID=A0ABS5RZ14_9HYPH|nr:TrkH family potassium uptake protein [Tianweitania aestuarii]MBS9722015.1 TrkH family potassium uptake protein [Tianweitania aestuarii]
MLIPLVADIASGASDWRAFAFASVGTTAVAVLIALASSSDALPIASPRFGILLINLLWMTLAVIGALPFMLSEVAMSPADALFESVSAITTTGSTVMVGLDSMPHGILVWRSLLQWMGGLGVIAMGLLLLPYLRVAGIRFFKLESSDISEKSFPRFQTFITGFIVIYVLMTLFCAIAYALAGMTPFDAANHAMTTKANGGFSTHDASFGAFGNNLPLLWVGTIFMFIGGLPFSVLILFALQGRLGALKDDQIRVYAGYTVCFIVAVAVDLRIETGMPFGYALSHSAFNFVSVITTTGFASVDYTLWGPFAVACIFCATFLGGCAGSTAGGIKAYRFLILYRMLVNGLHRLIYPNVVRPFRYGGARVEDDVQQAAVLFMACFFIIWAASSLLLSLTGLDFLTAITSALTALTNVGPGLGTIVGPAGNFSSLSDAAKYILALTMLLGRLEILTILVLISPAFWKT